MNKKTEKGKLLANSAHGITTSTVMQPKKNHCGHTPFRDAGNMAIGKIPER